jgi:hypothetical protein
LCSGQVIAQHRLAAGRGHLGIVGGLQGRRRSFVAVVLFAITATATATITITITVIARR